MPAEVLARAVRESSRRAATSPDVLSDVRCSLCSAPVPSGMLEEGVDQQFCCHSCRGAFAVLNACTLPGVDSTEVPASVFASFDEPEFHALHVRPPSEGSPLRSVDLLLENVTCASCVWPLERLPQMIAGVTEARMDLRQNTLSVTWDSSRVALSAIAAMLQRIGHRCHPAQGREAAQVRRAEDRAMLVRLAIAGALSGNIMMIAFAIYGGVLNNSLDEYHTVFRWLSMLLGVWSLVGPGRVFFSRAWSALRTRRMNLDLPICIALVVGGVSGVVNTVLNRGELYFDSLSMLVFLLLVGRYVQHRQQRWATDSLELLFSLMPRSARRIDVENGVEVARELPAERLQVGDIVEVVAGESIPADGIIERGTSDLDLSVLTGESMPAHAATGTAVHAGTVNLTSTIRVRATATGADTRAARLMKLVEDAAARRPAITKFTDRAGERFVVGIALLGIVTAIIWSFIDPSAALDHTTALLIVTCPCALGFAAPMVSAIAIGRGARRGILVKGGDVLETLSRPGLMLLDKTGTLTQGRAAVQAWVGDDDALSLAAALERHSVHPIARAIMAFAEARPINATTKVIAPIVHRARHTVGGGLEGNINDHVVLVGSPEFVAASLDAGLSATSPVRDANIARFAAEGLTPVVVAVDGIVRGVLGLGDALRDDARTSIDALRAQGWAIGILSGDHPAVVARVAGQLGLDVANCRGGMSPEDKAAFVRDAIQRANTRATAAQPAAPVVMVGDGVNDAAALSTASVGIAVHGGAEASLAAADVYLARPGLSPILELLAAGRGALTGVKATLWASLAYNLLAAAFAVVGIINPIVAAIFMPFSSITVLTIAFVWKTFPRELPEQQSSRSLASPRSDVATPSDSPVLAGATA
ncbi:MAG: cation-translocating P-type ATPase [Planctomycetota bacterium]|nr:cation-translocating P-type ATPase [Planctomycetota bacterium]